jgi:hypothetical protein
MLRGATAATTAVALTLVATGCGGGQRQDAGEHAATYPVAVPAATFPAHQSLAERVALRIAVRNTGNRTIPNVAATIEAPGGGTAADAFGGLNDAAGLASRSRPIWALDAGPVNGDTAYANTWALGPIAPNRTRTFVWHVVPIKAGRFTVTYRLSGSLTGKSGLRLAGGGVPHGSFAVDVSGKAPTVRVTADGRIVRVP